jgi:hypothetical protein
MILEHQTKLYVPVDPVGLLDDVRDWLAEMNVTGWTEFFAKGVWHDGNRLPGEPHQSVVIDQIRVIECWTENRLDVTPFMALLALHGECAGFAVQDGQAILEDF